MLSFIFRCQEGFTGDQCDEDNPFIVNTVDYILAALIAALTCMFIGSSFLFHYRVKDAWRHHRRDYWHFKHWTFTMYRDIMYGIVLYTQYTQFYWKDSLYVAFNQWRIYIVRFWTYPRCPNSFNFMHLLGKFAHKAYVGAPGGLALPPLGILDPPLLAPRNSPTI